MHIQIELLAIWPKNEEFMPRGVPFERGKLNIITGASKTGKSAIIPIIDYCLGSSDCFIPVDVIRDYAAWYGIVVHVSSKDILLARKAPLGDKISSEFYYSESVSEIFPLKIENSNATTDDIKSILNQISSISNISIDESVANTSFGARLSFRDLMAFTFQNQDIVANQSILFYKTHAYEHRERLKTWLPFILGAETIDILEARHRLKELEIIIKNLQKELSVIHEVTQKGAHSLRASLLKAREFGLISEKFDAETPFSTLLSSAMDILSADNSGTRVNLDAIEDISEELQELEQKKVNIGAAIFIKKKRLDEVQRLRRTVTLYRKNLKEKFERISIAKWLRENSEKTESCPLCGSTEHQASATLLQHSFIKIQEYEDSLKNTRKLPTTFAREETSLRKELITLLSEQESIIDCIEKISSEHSDAKQVYEYNQMKNQFIGSLRTTVDYAKKAVGNNRLEDQLNELNDEKQKTFDLIDEESIQKRLSEALYRLSRLTLNKLRTLDVEDKYRRVQPKFVIKDLSIMIQNNSASWHYLTEVGSASNWLAFHIATMCALQEFAIQMQDCAIPSFVIFDQPSQVYFPKVRTSANEPPPDDIVYDDEDIHAVRQIFETIATSIRSTNGLWQAIIVDHAGNEIYHDIENINEVAVWRNGEKLIPEKWLLAEENH